MIPRSSRYREPLRESLLLSDTKVRLNLDFWKVARWRPGHSCEISLSSYRVQKLSGVGIIKKDGCPLMVERGGDAKIFWNKHALQPGNEDKGSKEAVE